jgi:FHS family L-fucose permease-like MFS transporter
MIDAMDKHFQDKLHLSRSQSAWVQFAHYLGYFLIALPAGGLCRKLGYKGGIITGLGVVAAGAFWFVPATHIDAFWAFLLGVCVIAMGLTFLETVANPYTTVLGHKDYASTRINLAQSCNGIGFMMGPIIGGMFFYGSASAAENHERLYIPYAAVGVIVLVLAFVFACVKIPDLQTEDAYNLDQDETAGAEKTGLNRRGLKGLAIGIAAGLAMGAAYLWHGSASVEKAAGLEQVLICLLFVVMPGLLGFILGNYLSLWKHLHVTGGVFAQFLYVAAQAGIFSFFINYVVADMPPISRGAAGVLQAFRDIFPGDSEVVHTQANGLIFINEAGATILQGWVAFGLFLLGRLVGAAILAVAPAHRVLGVYGAVNAALMVLVFMQLGWVSVVAVFASFFFMSILFPTIFALGIFGLGRKAKLASSFLVMAIMGGAVMPKLMGWFSDRFGEAASHYGREVTGHNQHLMSPGFAVPLFCFAVIAIYGFTWRKLSKTDGSVAPDTSKSH